MSIRVPSTSSKDISIDQSQFKKTQKGFLLANQKRIERAKQGLEHSQKLVIDLLPLLFHVNHPMLPGYVSQKTPCGLSNFTPSKTELSIVKQLSKSFRYHSINSKENQLFSIFVMGSMGTLGQTRSSDIDIWLCYDPALKADEIAELKEKCSLICAWAKEKRLDLCFFPMNNEHFLDGKSTPLSEESSGSTQHYLLLDEFYRSSLYLGGRQPLWWFVPSEYERHYSHYCRMLLEKRFVRSEHVIDFGGLSEIPASEFITAAIWQMYKAIQSPYKSILKLVLLEVYAHEYPNPNFLSHQFKRCIETHPEDIDSSDPYCLLLTKIEAYLEENDHSKRLEIVRRSFYFKVRRLLSRSKQKTATAWQDSLLEGKIRHWGWRQDQLENLDNRKYWSVEKVIDERQRVVGDLMNSYRVLSEFSRQNNSHTSPLHDEITILGRKLYAAFERKTGKIEWINPDISPDISSAYLHFYSQDNSRAEHHWRLFTQRESTLANLQTPLKTSRSLTELAVWSYCNGIHDNKTRTLVHRPPLKDTKTFSAPEDSVLANIDHRYSIDDLFLALEGWQSLPLPKPDQSIYRQKPYAQSMMLIVNLDPIDESGQALVASDTQELKLDPFNTHSACASLIHKVELVVLNSWNELLVLTPPSNHSQTALPHLLTEILLAIPTHAGSTSPKISVYCRPSWCSQLLVQRLEALTEQMMQCFHSNPYLKYARFILCYEARYHLWQHQSYIEHHHFDDLNQLYKHLENSQPQLSPLVFDNHGLQQTPLHAMARLPYSKAIQVGYRLLNLNDEPTPVAEIYCLDERGSLFVDQLPFRDEYSLLRPLHQFIRSAIQRLCLTEQDQQFFGVYPVEFYRLKAPNHERVQWLAQRVDITTELTNLNFFNIQAIATSDSTTEGDYSFYCDDQAFHSLDYGAKTYRRVASYILARRRHAERYPCYITDLDLSSNHSGGHNVSLQLIDYLKVKSRLENALNQALQSI